jgi:hypothetical protein
MNLRQQADARPLLQMPAQGRAADLISGRFQTAPRRALSEKLTQGRQHPNRRRSGMAATLLRRGRAEIDNCRDEVQKSKIQHLLPCLTPQTWSFQTDNAPHQGCITAIPSNPSARDPTTHGISGNCLLGRMMHLVGAPFKYPANANRISIGKSGVFKIQLWLPTPRAAPLAQDRHWLHRGTSELNRNRPGSPHMMHKVRSPGVCHDRPGRPAIVTRPDR